MSVNVINSRSMNGWLPISRSAYDTVAIALPDVAVAETDETKAFFLKMIGDYYRYVAECA